MDITATMMDFAAREIEIMYAGHGYTGKVTEIIPGPDTTRYVFRLDWRKGIPIAPLFRIPREEFDPYAHVIYHNKRGAEKFVYIDVPK